MTEEEQFVDLYTKHDGDAVEAARRMFSSGETPKQRADRLMASRVVKKLIKERGRAETSVEVGGLPKRFEHLTPKESMDELLKLYYEAESVREKKDILTLYMKCGGYLDERIHVTQETKDVNQIDWSVYTEEEIAQLEYLLSKGWIGG